MAKFFRSPLSNILIAGLTIVFALLATPLIAEESLTINSIDIVGNSYFSEDEILNVLNIKEGDLFSYEELNNNLQHILKLYALHGFYQTKILPPEIVPEQSGHSVNIKIQILENQKLITGEIHFAGNNYFTAEQLQNLISTRQNQPFSIENLNADLKTIVDEYGERGYPFCEAAIDSFTITDNTIDIYLQIHENDFVRISEIVCQGNEVTKDRTIELITNFEPNEIYKNSQVESAKRRLLQKPYIEKADILPLNSKQLLVTIEESQMNHIEGLIGYNSAQEGSSFTDNLTGYVDFSFRNILGTDREIALKWQHLQKNSTNFFFSYREPFIFGEQIAIRLTFQRENIDTIYVDSKLSIASLVKMSTYDEIGVSLSTENSLLNGNRTRMRGVSGEWQRNTFDYLYNPRTGYNTKFSYGINWENRENYIQEIMCDAQVAIPLKNRNVIFLQGETKQLYSTSDTIAIYKMYTFGGYNSLRGFIDNQFRADKFCILSMEYRYLLSKESRAYVFCDYSYSKPYDSLFGLGFGIRLKTGIGFIKIDYGIGYQNGKWTSPLDGTLHFGFEAGL